MRRKRLGALSGLAAIVVLSLGVAARDVSLVEAVKAGDATTIRALLARATDMNSADPDGTSALHWAVHRDDEQTVDLLIRSGARVQAANRYGVTPLSLASLNGNAAIVARLLEAGADPNTTLPDGETALMTAARTGSVPAVKALLAAGADVHAREPAKGQDALMWAAADNHAAVVAALLEAGADMHARSAGGAFTPFLFAVRAGHIETARLLMEAGADANEAMPDGTSALLVSMINAHYELAALLLDHGADPNADAQGWTALHQVVWSRRHNVGFNLPGPVATGSLDSLDLVRKLVARGADVNARQKKEPRDGNRNMLNRIGSTPFLLAAKSADVPLMRVLLDLGADPSLTTDRGTTALMVAAGVGIWAPGESPGTHEEALAAVQLALAAGGGGVNDIDQDGETAVHGAVYRGGAVPVIQFLADRGAVLDVRNRKGWTPLVAAEGVEYTPNVLKRYPEAAALLRRLMAEGRPRAAEPAPSASARAQESRKTMWDGVFTQAQAERGEKAYQQSCATCHQEDLLGAAGTPGLVGSEFSERWDGSTLDDMVQTIRRTMPQDAPETLPPATYVDIVSFLLNANGGPAGATELTTDRAMLQQILITSRTAR